MAESVFIVTELDILGWPRIRKVCSTEEEVNKYCEAKIRKGSYATIDEWEDGGERPKRRWSYFPSEQNQQK